MKVFTIISILLATIAAVSATAEPENVCRDPSIGPNQQIKLRRNISPGSGGFNTPRQ
ncbi:hypothetical protein HDU96_005668 [Phlyctochytrium bullatum]|nr:hypothetical protein HDU96_005668 [Phlyctochytrium bullatum]